jgi:hypothetical protein
LPGDWVAVDMVSANTARPPIPSTLLVIIDRYDSAAAPSPAGASGMRDREGIAAQPLHDRHVEPLPKPEVLTDSYKETRSVCGGKNAADRREAEPGRGYGQTHRRVVGRLASVTVDGVAERATS